MTTSSDEPAFNAVDELMSRVDEINAKAPTDLTDNDIDVLVAYHRRNRAKLAAGDKPPRSRGSGSKTAIPLAELISLAKPAVLEPKPSTPTIPRSVLRRI